MLPKRAPTPAPRQEDLLSALTARRRFSDQTRWKAIPDLHSATLRSEAADGVSAAPRPRDISVRSSDSWPEPLDVRVQSLPAGETNFPPAHHIMLPTWRLSDVRQSLDIGLCPDLESNHSSADSLRNRHRESQNIIPIFLITDPSFRQRSMTQRIHDNEDPYSQDLRLSTRAIRVVSRFSKSSAE